MVEIKLAESAWNDLNNITDFISKDSPRHAKLFTESVFERIEIIYKFKNSGRIVPEFQNTDIRELIMGSYRIVYRIYKENLIIVLRIIHNSRLLDF